MELIIHIDADAKMPLYEQIYEYIKNEIKSGNIKAGERLPSTRILSGNLMISRQTVTYAYDQLVAEGYIESRPGRGFFASKIDSLINIQA